MKKESEAKWNPEWKPTAEWSGACLAEAWRCMPANDRSSVGDLMAARLDELTTREPKTVFAIRTENGFWGKGVTLQAKAHQAMLKRLAESSR